MDEWEVLDGERVGTAFGMIPLKESLRLVEEVYDPDVDYADVLASMISHLATSLRSD